MAGSSEVNNNNGEVSEDDEALTTWKEDWEFAVDVSLGFTLALALALALVFRILFTSSLSCGSTSLEERTGRASSTGPRLTNRCFSNRPNSRKRWTA